jgi:outer membrane protein TolC
MYPAMRAQLRESYQCGASSKKNGGDVELTGKKVRGGKSLIRRRIAVSIVPALILLLAQAPARGQGTSGVTTTSSTSSSSSGSQSSSGLNQSAAAPSTQGGDFSGSVPSQLVPGVLPLSLQDAIDRGLKQNLGLLLSSSDVGSARGQRWQQLSNLLPHLNLQPYADVSQVNLAEFGFTFHFPGITIPTIVGPFAYFDARAYLTQSLLDLKSLSNTHAASERIKAAEYTYKDARDLVVLAVGYAYLQGIADESQIDSVAAQVDTAQALYKQADDQVNAGTSPAIDALRAKVELQTRQQQLIQAKNDFAIQKLSLARTIGLAPGQQFDLSDKSPYQPIEALSPDEALKRAYESRSDLQAAQANVRAAEYARRAAVAGRYPTVSFSGDYGDAGQHFDSSHGVMDVRGTVTVPLFTGGMVHGDVLEAEAQLRQAQDRLANLRGQIDSDVRVALLNLESASQEVIVTQSNIDLAEQSLTQSRDRFAAGVTDTVEVVQAQEAVATAHQSYISSLYLYNYAKISLARAMGASEQGVKEYFKGK